MNRDWTFGVSAAALIAVIVFAIHTYIKQSHSSSASDLAKPTKQGEAAATSPNDERQIIESKDKATDNETVDSLRERCTTSMRVSTPQAMRDPEACELYAKATIKAYPSPAPSRTATPAATQKPHTLARRTAQIRQQRHSAISVYDCHLQAKHGSIADRKCRSRVSATLKQQCRTFRFKFQNASDSGSRENYRKLMNSYCREADHYTVFD